MSIQNNNQGNQLKNHKYSLLSQGSQNKGPGTMESGGFTSVKMSTKEYTGVGLGAMSIHGLQDGGEGGADGGRQYLNVGVKSRSSLAQHATRTSNPEASKQVKDTAGDRTNGALATLNDSGSGSPLRHKFGEHHVQKGSHGKAGETVEDGGDSIEVYGENQQEKVNDDPRAIQKTSFESFKPTLKNLEPPQGSNILSENQNYVVQIVQSNDGNGAENANLVRLSNGQLAQVIEFDPQGYDSHTYDYDTDFMNVKSQVSLASQKHNSSTSYHPSQYRSGGLKHMKVNWKKLQLQDIKNMEIERENRILLTKMQKIYNSRPAQGYPSALKYRHPGQQPAYYMVGGGRTGPAIDDSLLEASKQFHRKNYKLKTKQKKEKIELENQRMLQRLQNKKSIYDIEKWEQDEFQRQRLLRRVSKEPRVGAVGVKDSVQFELRRYHGSPESQSPDYARISPVNKSDRLITPTRSNMAPSGAQSKQEKYNNDLQVQLQRYYQSTITPKRQNQRQGGSVNAHHYQSMSIDGGQQASQSPRYELGQPRKLHQSPNAGQRSGVQQQVRNRVLFQKGVLVNEQFYMCEISQNHKGYYINLAPIDKGFLPSPANSSNLQLFLGHDNLTTHQILSHHQRNFASIAHSLKLRNGRISVGMDGNPRNQGVGVMDGSSPMKNQNSSISLQPAALSHDIQGNTPNPQFTQSHERLNPRKAAAAGNGAGGVQQQRGEEVRGEEGPMISVLEEYQNVEIGQLKSSISSKAINGKYNQGLLKKNKSSKFRKGSEVNLIASDDNSNSVNNLVVFKVAKADSQLRKTVDSPMNLTQIARSMPKMKVYSNAVVGHRASGQQQPEGSTLAVRLHELSRQTLKQSTKIPQLKGGRLFGQEFAKRKFDHGPFGHSGHSSSQLHSSASRTLMANSVISANRPLDMEARIKEDHNLQLQRAYQLPLKKKVRLDQHGPVQYHSSSMLKGSHSNKSRKQPIIQQQLQSHKDKRRVLNSLFDPQKHSLQGQGYDPAAQYSNRSHNLSKGSKSKANSVERPQIFLIESEGTKSGAIRKKNLAFHRESRPQLTYSTKGSSVVNGRPLYGNRQSNNQSEEPLRPRIVESNSLADLPSIYNSKLHMVNSKVSGAVPSFPEHNRQVPRLNDAMNLRIPQYLGETQANGGNIIINIGPVTQSNIKTVELLDPYGSVSPKINKQTKTTNKTENNTTGNSMEFRRNTAKAMLYEQEKERSSQKIAFQARNEVENAYELKPRKIIKKRKSNVFDRLSRTKKSNDNSSFQDQNRSSAAIGGQVIRQVPKSMKVQAQGQVLQPHKESSRESQRSFRQNKSVNSGRLPKQTQPARDKSPQENNSQIRVSQTNLKGEDKPGGHQSTRRSRDSKLPKVITSQRSMGESAGGLGGETSQSRKLAQIIREHDKKMQQKSQLYVQSRLTFQNKDMRQSNSPTSTMKKSVNSDLVDLKIGVNGHLENRSSKNFDKARQSLNRLKDAGKEQAPDSIFETEDARKGGNQKSRSNNQISFIAHQHMNSSIHNVKSPKASDRSGSNEQKKKILSRQRLNTQVQMKKKNERDMEPSSNRSTNSMHKRTMKTANEDQDAYHQKKEEEVSMSYQDDHNIQSFHASKLHQMNMQTQQNIMYADSSNNLYNDTQSQTQIQKSMVKTNQFSKKRRRRVGIATDSGQSSQFEKGDRKSHRNTVEENGGILQPDSLLEEIKREVSEYSQSQKRHFQKNSSKKVTNNLEARASTDNDFIQETSSEGSDAYMTPEMLHSKRKSLMAAKQRNSRNGNTIGQGVGYNTQPVQQQVPHLITVETEEGAQQTQPEQDFAKNGQDDCVSFSGQNRSSEFQYQKDKKKQDNDEVKQMNQTGQFSAEPKTTNQQKSISESLQYGSQEPKEQTHPIPGSVQEEIEEKINEKDNSSQVKLNEHLSENDDDDGYSNDFIQETSSSRGAASKYGQLDESLDAMRLNSFPILQKKSGRKRSTRQDLGSPDNILIQKDLIISAAGFDEPERPVIPQPVGRERGRNGGGEGLEERLGYEPQDDSLGLPYKIEKEMGLDLEGQAQSNMVLISSPHRPHHPVLSKNMSFNINDSMLSKESKHNVVPMKIAIDPKEPSEKVVSESQKSYSQDFNKQSNRSSDGGFYQPQKDRSKGHQLETNTQTQNVSHDRSQVQQVGNGQIGRGERGNPLDLEEHGASGDNLQNAGDPSVTFSMKQLNPILQKQIASKQSSSEDFYSDDFQEPSSERREPGHRVSGGTGQT